MKTPTPTAPPNNFSHNALAAPDTIERDKAGFLPPFLSSEELDELLEAWHRLASLPDVQWEAQRFITDARLYDEPVFARLATHPVVQEAARRTIGDFQLASYAVVATPRNGSTPTTRKTVQFHVDHCVYSDVPVPQARDTFVCVWVNFEELAMENGPFALAVGTHHLNIGWEYFADETDKSAAVAAMGWEKCAAFNTGPAGSTAVYSGKTWHAGTINASDVIRKGLNINFVPKEPLDTNHRNHFDVCGLGREQYERLADMIAIPNYLIEHQPDTVTQTI